MKKACSAARTRSGKVLSSAASIPPRQSWSAWQLCDSTMAI
ncbi:Uncharacterised protein [Bordetella pertussis]|nr:Uncharacterised protein [Bordetella pertussis]